MQKEFDPFIPSLGPKGAYDWKRSFGGGECLASCTIYSGQYKIAKVEGVPDTAIDKNMYHGKAYIRLKEGFSDAIVAVPQLLNVFKTADSLLKTLQSMEIINHFQNLEDDINDLRDAIENLHDKHGTP